MNPLGPASGSASEAAEKLPLPPQLVRHLRDGRLVLFAGAGLSAMAGLPTWGPLLKRLIDTTVAESMATPEAAADLARLHEAGKWLQVADHCREQLGERYVSLLGAELRGDAVAIPEAHRLAMRLPFAAWVTTNYDKLLERAFTAEKGGGMAKTLTHLDADTLGTLLFDDVPYILKAHGDIDKPDSIVFTSRDYRELIHGNAAFAMAFSAVLLTRAVLFVGYSLSDPDFNLMLDRQLVTFRGFVPERYALMSAIGEVERNYLWRVARIRVIEYPKGRHELVTQFFRQLTAEVGTGAGAPPPPPPSPPAAPAPMPAGPPSAAAAAPAGEPRAGATTAPRAPRVLRVSIGMTSAGFRVAFEDRDERISPALPERFEWATLTEAFRPLGTHRGPEETRDVVAALGEALAKAIEGPSLQALAARLDGRAEVQVVLQLDANVEPMPWELVAVNGRALCLLAPVCREPVGISAAARGRPALNPPLRALVIGNPSDGVMDLPGAEAEAREIARLIGEAGDAQCRLLLGREATLEQVHAVLAADRPHILHFAGHAWFEADEPFLFLADGRLPVGMLRPWIARNPPALLFLNSHYTSFVPPGVAEEGMLEAEQAIQSGLAGKAGFADLAMRAGASAFIGSFMGAISDEGAQRFALVLYRSLFAGSSVTQAAWVARREALTPYDATSLTFSLHGDGQLRIPMQVAGHE